jgi:hypothetical protein
MISGMRVAAVMAEPIVYYGDGLHLDGILALAVWRALPPQDRELVPPITDSWAVDFDLPLGRWRLPADPEVGHPQLREADGAVWGWLATQALNGWQLHRAHEVRKRPAVQELIEWTDTKAYNPGLGPMKSYDLSYPTFWSPRVEWEAVGQPDAVRVLLTQQVYGIGKGCAKGMGRVLRWEVEPALEVTAETVMARRRVPVPQVEATAFAGIRPPYHHKSRECWLREPSA